MSKLSSFFLFIILFLVGETAMALTLTSTAFKNGATIPTIYTCKGQDISPNLSWSNVPEGTQSLVLIVDDPDAPAGVWTHWVLFNIPSKVSGLDENMKSLPTGTQEGKNSRGQTGYHGPCPPSGEHRYFFKLYALDTTLNLPKGATKSQLESAMKGHIIDNTELMGRFAH